LPDESRTKKRSQREPSADDTRATRKQSKQKDRARKQRRAAGPRPPILDLPDRPEPPDADPSTTPTGKRERVLFGWREPRKRALCRPSSAYRFLADLNGLEATDLDPRGTYLYLGRVPNRPGRCAVIDAASGRVLTRHHPEDFEELPEDEA
jgi:hypothetical protein